jgi:hypothetical protein
VQDRDESFTNKLKFWKKCLESGTTECFDTLHDLLVENNLQMDDRIKTTITKQLRGL